MRILLSIILFCISTICFGQLVTTDGEEIKFTKIKLKENTVELQTEYGERIISIDKVEGFYAKIGWSQEKMLFNTSNQHFKKS